jgi:hypothetical protein
MSGGRRHLSQTLEAETAYAVPLGKPERRRGLLVVLLQRPPLFVDDDLALLSLLCEQANLALEQWELLEAQAQALRRELAEAPHRLDADRCAGPTRWGSV